LQFSFEKLTHCAMVQNPLKIQEKNSKKFLGGIYPGIKNTLQLVPGTTIE
jgi:hypothetical protein